MIQTDDPRRTRSRHNFTTLILTDWTTKSFRGMTSKRYDCKLTDSNT